MIEFFSVVLISAMSMVTYLLEFGVPVSKGFVAKPLFLLKRRKLVYPVR